MTDFSKIAARYEKDSVVQRSASDQLFDLLEIEETEDVMDLGCGTGHLTRKIRQVTGGKVVGVDASEGMIKEARASNPDLDAVFEVCRVERLPYRHSFDVIFCNSTLQWFKNVAPALASCYTALRPNGRMGIQAPARQDYSPNFVAAVERARLDPRLRDQFEAFELPWLFLDTAEEYRALFEKAGFDVLQARIDRIESRHTAEDVCKIFESGAAAGYLNQECYRVPLPDYYADVFRSAVREAFREQADPDGKVNLTFFRIYLLAMKK